MRIFGLVITYFFLVDATGVKRDWSGNVIVAPPAEPSLKRKREDDESIPSIVPQTGTVLTVMN